MTLNQLQGNRDVFSILKRWKKKTIEGYNLFRPLTILPRRDKEQNWIRENPILRQKEICVVYSDEGTKYKLGDGKTDYIHLPFTSIEIALEQGVMYTPNRLVRVKGFTKDYECKKEGENYNV